MASSNYVPQVDYTSKDYESIREDLIALIPYFAPEWTNRDPSDFGMTLIELFSYIGDNLSYYIDRSANESFITTASQRDSVLSLARVLGYTPTEGTAALVYLTFYNSTATPATVPALTQVSTSIVSNGVTTQVTFETLEDVTVPAKVGSTSGSAQVYAQEGETKTEKIGTSDGSVNQIFQLSDSPVISKSTIVTVAGINYTQVEYIIDYQNYDPVFIAVVDSDEQVYLQFGDGINGRIPPNGVDVYATYRVGGGKNGNVPAGTIKYILTPVPTGISVNNIDVGQVLGSGSGGAEPESTDSIRTNAPKSIRALNRAVALTDYSAIAIQVTGVAKAISIAEVYSNVTIYIAPYGDSGLQSDGVTSSLVFNNLATQILDYFVDKTAPGVTITLQPPKYVNTQLKMDVVVLSQYKNSQVEFDVNAALQELFTFDNVSFNDRINLQDVLAVVNDVIGVSRATVSKLVRSDEEQTFAINNRVLAGNVATLTTSVNHNLTVGQTVLVSAVNSAVFNGTAVVTAVTSNTFSYALVATAVGSAATVTGSVTALTVKDIICSTNELPQAGTFDVTVSGGFLS